MSLLGANLPLYLEQGATYTSPTYTVKKGDGSLENLTGWTALMKIRTSPYGSGSNPGTVLLTLTDGSGITLGGAAGTVIIGITHAQTLALLFGTFWYDLMLTDGSGNVLKLLSGPGIVGPTVSQ